MGAAITAPPCRTARRSDLPFSCSLVRRPQARPAVPATLPYVYVKFKPWIGLTFGRGVELGEILGDSGRLLLAGRLDYYGVESEPWETKAGSAEASSRKCEWRGSGEKE